MRNCIISYGRRGWPAPIISCIIDLVAARGGWPPRDALSFAKWVLAYFDFALSQPAGIDNAKSHYLSRSPGGAGRHNILHRSRGCQGGLAATRCLYKSFVAARSVIRLPASRDPRWQWEASGGEGNYYLFIAVVWESSTSCDCTLCMPFGVPGDVRISVAACAVRSGGVDLWSPAPPGSLQFFLDKDRHLTTDKGFLVRDEVAVFAHEELEAARGGWRPQVGDSGSDSARGC
jgi:hypothetical protein